MVQVLSGNELCRFSAGVEGSLLKDLKNCKSLVSLLITLFSHITDTVQAHEP